MTELAQRNELVAYDNPPPAPMAIFDERVIHPENARWVKEAEERLNRFHPIPRLKLYKMQWRMNRLNRLLNRRGVFDLIEVLQTLNEELHTKALIVYRDVRAEAARLRDECCPLPPDVFARGRKARQRVIELNNRLNVLEMQVAPYEGAYEEYMQLYDAINEHIETMKRKEAEDKNKKQFYREGKIIAKALRETFMMTEGCHVKRFRRNGKIRKIPPKFQEIYLNSMVHSFVLLTSKRTAFGGFKNKLQVDIQNLIDPKTTLKNASAILHRQVWVDYDQTGSLPIFKVNRMDVRDGLPERVLFAGIMEIYPVGEHELIPVPLGLSESFRAIWSNLESTPHWIIAGATRSGKSNFSNQFLCNLLHMQSPEELRLVAIDGKAGVEFFRYKDVPQLAMPVVDDANQVLSTLVRILAVMERRFKRLKDSGTTKISDFNRAMPDDQRMPRLVVFVDEMFTLLNRDDTTTIHNALNNLTAKGAAAGIHVVMATQYPSAEVIPMTIKGNCDGIVGLRMPNIHASLMLFQSDEAYRLERVKGRAFISDAGERFKVQTPYISNSEIDRSIRRACMKYKPTPFSELDDLSDTAPVEVIALALIEEPDEKTDFTELDALEIVFDQMDGYLIGERLWEIVKEQNLTTAAKARTAIRELKKRKVIEFGGRKFHPQKVEGNNVYRLVEIEDDEELTTQQAVETDTLTAETT